MCETEARGLNSVLRPRRRGLTLIEVTAGLLILSTLLVASIVAFQQRVRQARRARRTLSAISAADELLDAWFAARGAVPQEDEGEVHGDDSLLWRTTIVGAEQSDDRAWRIVRLQLTDALTPDAAFPLVEADVVVPGENAGGRR